MDYFSQKILDKVSKNNLQLVSFDIFDTLVYRRCATPQQVFSHAFDLTSEQLNLTITAEEYRELRERTETKARQVSKRGEICLTEIFAQLPFGIAINQQLLNAELKAEQQLGFLNQQLIELITLLQGKGINVVLISDMYLSAKQIQQCFFQSSVFAQLPLYVSSEYECTKYSGDLFRLIKEKEQINYRQWLHLGDHLESDYRVPNLLGIDAIHYSPVLDCTLLNRAEQRIFYTRSKCRSIRTHASLNAYVVTSPVSYQLGSYTWGAILVSFADWVIDQTIAQGSSDIICITREGKIFKSVIDKRLAARGLIDIAAYLLYASRRSTLLASINTEAKDWLASMFQLMLLRRDYTVADFYMDLSLPADEVFECFENELLADVETLYFEGCSLFIFLKGKIEKDVTRIKSIIKEQQRLFSGYFAQVLPVPLNKCVVVDFGGGGSIHYQLQQVLKDKAAANLLFYSSERIYRYSSNMFFSAFLGVHNDSWSVRAILNRSCEAIEALFVVHSGSVLGYKELDGSIKPIQEKSIKENQLIAKAFQLGIDTFCDSFQEYGFETVSQSEAIAILSRFLRYPTREESKQYEHIYHPDNLGVSSEFSVVSPRQIDFINSQGANNFLNKINRTTDALRNETVWPEAVASIIAEEELFFRSGLMANEGEDNIEKLLRKIVGKGWKKFSIYGAGQFFNELVPKLAGFGLNIENVIDRKAEFSTYKVLNYSVGTLNNALEKGSTQFVIASYAFKNEIASMIYERAKEKELLNVEILSL